MFKLAVFDIQHLNPNRDDFFAFIIFLCIKLQERLIKIQRFHISKSYLKFQRVPELSHSVQPPPPSPPSFFVEICQFKFFVMAEKAFGL